MIEPGDQLPRLANPPRIARGFSVKRAKSLSPTL